MANKKISTLDPLGATPDASDIIPITDVSDTSGSAQGTTKKVTVGELQVRTKDIVTKTLSFTLTDAENGKVVWCNSSARLDITVPSGLVSGFNCRVVQGGTGKVRFLTSGTTVNGYISASNTPNATIGQHGVADLIPTASDTYVLMGDIEYLFVYGNTKSLYFDGADDYVALGNISELNSATSYSISFWYREDSHTPGQANTASVFLFSSRTAFGPYLQTYATHFIFISDANQSSANAGYRPSADVWHHAVLTFGNSTSKVFLDGVFKASAAVAATTAAIAGNGFQIGKRSSGFSATEVMDGYMDDFAIFSEELTDGGVSLNATAGGQVADLYNGRASGAGTGGSVGTPGDLSSFENPSGQAGKGGLVHWWNFEDTPNDQVGSNHGTLNGATTGGLPTYQPETP